MTVNYLSITRIYHFSDITWLHYIASKCYEGFCETRMHVEPGDTRKDIYNQVSSTVLYRKIYDNM